MEEKQLFDPEKIIKDSFLDHARVLAEAGAQHLMKTGDRHAICLLYHLRKENYSREEFLALKDTVEKMPIVEESKKKLIVAVVTASLPAFAFRKAIWQHNIDFSSIAAFFRRITPAQMNALNSVHAQLMDGIVPDECKQTLTEKFLAFVGRMTAEKILNGDFDHRVSMKFLSKGAWAYNLFSLDFGFGRYPNGEHDDTEVGDIRWTGFVSTKQHINDFVVNKEGGLYWFLYSFARSNPLWNTDKPASMNPKVCPAFWATMLFHLIFWIVSPLVFLLMMTSTVLNVHWPIAVKIPIAIIGLFTPVLCTLGSIKTLTVLMLRSKWFASLTKGVFQTERAVRNWIRLAWLLVVLVICGVFVGISAALLVVVNHAGGIVFIVPLMLFVYPFLKVFIKDGIFQGKRLNGDDHETIGEPEYKNGKINDFILSKRFFITSSIVFIFGFVYPFIPKILAWLENAGITCFRYLVFHVVPFFGRIIVGLVDVWAALLFLGVVAGSFWAVAKLMKLQEQPAWMTRMINSKWLFNAMFVSFLVLFAATFGFAFYQAGIEFDFQSFGGAFLILVGFITVIYMAVKLAPVALEIQKEDPELALEYLEIYKKANTEWKGIFSDSAFYWIIKQNSWLRDNFDKVERPILDAILRIKSNYFWGSVSKSGESQRFFRYILEKMNEGTFQFMASEKITSGESYFMDHAIGLFRLDWHRFNNFLKRWQADPTVNPEALLTLMYSERAEEREKERQKDSRKRAFWEKVGKPFGFLLVLIGGLLMIIFWPFKKLWQLLCWMGNTIKDIGDLKEVFEKMCPTVAPEREL